MTKAPPLPQRAVCPGAGHWVPSDPRPGVACPGSWGKLKSRGVLSGRQTDVSSFSLKVFGVHCLVVTEEAEEVASGVCAS